MQCSAVQCSAVQCSAVQCSAVQIPTDSCINITAPYKGGHRRANPGIIPRDDQTGITTFGGKTDHKYHIKTGTVQDTQLSYTLDVRIWYVGLEVAHNKSTRENKSSFANINYYRCPRFPSWTKFVGALSVVCLVDLDIPRVTKTEYCSPINWTTGK